MSIYHFQGHPCEKCGSTIRYISCNRCVTCLKNYSQTTKRKLYDKERNKNEKRKESRRRYSNLRYQTSERKLYQNMYYHTAKGRATNIAAAIKNRAKRLNAEGFYTTQEWINLKEQYDNRCLCCGRHQSELDRVLEQDHIIPLSKAGTNWISNIQPLCHDCNGMGGKGVKTIDYR